MTLHSPYFTGSIHDEEISNGFVSCTRSASSGEYQRFRYRGNCNDPSQSGRSYFYDTRFGVGRFRESWHTLCMTTGVDMSNAEPDKLDSTTLCSFAKESSIGLAGETEGSIAIFDTPGDAGLAKLQNTAQGTPLAFRHTWDSGEELFNAEAVYGGGYSATVNTLVTGSISATLKKPILSYAAP